MFCTLLALSLLGSSAGGTEPLLPRRRKSFSEPKEAVAISPLPVSLLVGSPCGDTFAGFMDFGDALLAGGEAPGVIPSKSLTISWLTHLQEYILLRIKGP